MDTDKIQKQSIYRIKVSKVEISKLLYNFITLKERGASYHWYCVGSLLISSTYKETWFKSIIPKML